MASSWKKRAWLHKVSSSQIKLFLAYGTGSINHGHSRLLDSLIFFVCVVVVVVKSVHRMLLFLRLRNFLCNYTLFLVTRFHKWNQKSKSMLIDTNTHLCAKLFTHVWLLINSLRPVVLVKIPCIFLMYLLLYFLPKYAEFALTSITVVYEIQCIFYAIFNPPPINKKISKSEQTKLRGSIHRCGIVCTIVQIILVLSPKRLDITMMNNNS